LEKKDRDVEAATAIGRPAARLLSFVNAWRILVGTWFAIRLRASENVAPVQPIEFRARVRLTNEETMRTQIARTFSFCLLFCLSGCGNKTPASNQDIQSQVNRPAAVSEPALAPWEIRFESQCPENVPLDHCPGKYGFSVLSDGSYEVGPGPKGQKFSGVLDADEMKQIVQNIREEVLSFQIAQNCGKEDSIEITYDDRESTSCHPKIREQMKKFISQYYPETFPNPCIDASSDLSQLYDVTSACDSNADCVFLDSEFLPLNPLEENLQSIAVDDCTYIRPLVVANSFKAVSLQRELLNARAHAREVCGDHIFKPSCSDVQYTSPSKGNSICFKHQCHLRTV
jgi:hypothetical protein